MIGRSALFIGAALLLAACGGGPPGEGEVITAAVAEPGGALRPIQARLCLPPPRAGGGPARLVVVNHGSPGADRAARARYALLPCGSAIARHFLARGQAVLAPLRRGYGADEGPWMEGFGACESPDYAGAARETGRDIRGAVAAARARPEVAPEGIAVIGQSAGGWGTLALAADPPPGVSAVVAVAPGRGGRRGDRPNDNCRPDRLAEDTGRLAAAGGPGALPVLWLHTPNDSFFGTELVAAMAAAHARAGGRATLLALPAYGRDGHDLFYGRGGEASWGPPVDAWLDAHP
ncbi:alpha/beta hydrolase [Muricoccus nepalensis]|uniref:alpha/beta hydrolase n=1 Tax=Muricoccus nepalensis TaxID=1854500 RepID=UPI0019D59A0C|nr:hypothetical protein [Roseomonas nepalensis]